MAKFEDLSPAEKANLATAQAQAAQEAAAAAARKAQRDAALRDTPANVNSIPALREEVNKIKAVLRGDL